MTNIICNECETVAHCMNNGCVPKQPAYRAVKTYHEGKPVYVAEQPAPATQFREQEPVELCQYGQEPASCTSNPMDCQCAIDAALAQPAQPIIKSYLEKDNSLQPLVVPDALTAQDPETLEYILGWNDCRQAVMEMLKEKNT